MSFFDTLARKLRNNVVNNKLETQYSTNHVRKSNIGEHRNKKFEGIQFPEYIQIDTQKYFIDVIFSSKRSSSVVIREDKLIFRMSSYLTKSKAEEHFAELLKKIYKKIEKTPNKKIKTIQDVLSDMQFNFSDTLYRIEYATKVRSVKFESDIFYINPKTKPELIEKHIIKILIEKYTQRVQNYVLAVNSRSYNFNFRNIELKFVSSKWGHCTGHNDLMFNLKLLNAPIEVFDYVIIHELAHIRHKNHSAAYWREVSRFCPNYKRIRKMLKDNPPQLFK